MSYLDPPFLFDRAGRAPAPHVPETMADPNDNDTPISTAEGDGVPDATPDAPVPNAAAEPAAQVTAPAAETIPPPVPADYEMPDDYATQDPLATAKAWVEDHPGLAVLAAAGTGLLVGRIVSALIPDPDPPTLAERVEKRAKVLRKEAKKQSKVFQKEAAKQGKVYKKQALSFADDAGDTLQDSLHRASEALREAASRAGDSAEEGYEKTKDLAETIADAVKVAMTGVVATKIDDWVDKVRS